MRTQQLIPKTQNVLGHSDYWASYLNRQKNFGKIKASYERQIALFIFIATMAILMTLTAKVVHYDMKYDIQPGHKMQDTATQYIGIRHHF